MDMAALLGNICGALALFVVTVFLVFHIDCMKKQLKDVERRLSDLEADKETDGKIT